MEEPTDLLTTHQAVELFKHAGLSEPTFHRRVRQGQIPAILPEGRQRGAMYSKEQVLAALGKKAKKLRKTVAGATFTKMEPVDMLRVAPVISEYWGPPNIERWSSLIARNSEIGYMLVSNQQEIVGCGFLFSHTEQKILDILNREVTPITHVDEILPYEANREYCLYARTLCITKKASAIEQRFWGALLIRNLMRTVIALGERGIVIRRIYGRSDTPEGEKLMRDVGFTQIRTVTSHKNFVIDIATSGLDIVLRYEKALNQWRLKNSGEGI